MCQSVSTSANSCLCLVRPLRCRPLVAPSRHTTRPSATSAPTRTCSSSTRPSSTWGPAQVQHRSGSVHVRPPPRPRDLKPLSFPRPPRCVGLLPDLQQTHEQPVPAGNVIAGPRHLSQRKRFCRLPDARSRPVQDSRHPNGMHRCCRCCPSSHMFQKEANFPAC